MKKLSGATAKKVTADWAEQFPELVVFEPLVLFRRVGPLLHGIGFERNRASDAYVPSTGVQFLGFPYGDALAGLDTRLRTSNGNSWWLELKWHESEYQDAAGKLREQSPVPFDGFTLPAVLKAHRDRAESLQLPDTANGVQELEVLALLPGLLGRDDLVEDGLKLARKLSADWPADWYQRWQKPADWLDDLARRAADRTGLQKIVDNEVKTIGLDDVPFSELPDQ